MMSWPTRPWPQSWMPSTCVWKKMLSSWTSGYQRYWTNSTPAYWPAACACSSGLVSVIVFAAGVDRGDLTDLDVLGRQARRDPLAGLELRHAREAERRVARRRGLRDLRILGLERADGLLVRHAGDHAVGGLRVELHVMDVDVGLGEAGEVVRVVLEARERHCHAVADVGANRERLNLLRAVEHVRRRRGRGRTPCRSDRWPRPSSPGVAGRRAPRR